MYNANNSLSDTMKLRNYIIAAAAVMMLAACSQPQGKKVAVVYFSKSGNTQAVAEAFAETLNSLTDQKDANLFRAELISLTPTTPYPEDYQATIEESREECLQDLGRELSNATLKDLDKYDVIFLGYPVWFGTYAPPVKTFAEANNLLAGKKVVPFCTFGTGGRVSSVNALKALCPDAVIVDSYGLRDKRMDQTADEVSYFVSTIAADLLKECCGKDCEGKKDCCKEKEANADKACCKEKVEGAEKACDGHHHHHHAEGEVCEDGCCDKETWRELTAEDLTIFNSAVADFTRMQLEPINVKNEALPGANRIYECTTVGRDGEPQRAQAYILAPLGGGKPELTAVERL